MGSELFRLYSDPSFSAMEYLGKFSFDDTHNHSGETVSAAQLIVFSANASVQLRLSIGLFWPIRPPNL
jgi:hypothetical protein